MWCCWSAPVVELTHCLLFRCLRFTCVTFRNWSTRARELWQRNHLSPVAPSRSRRLACRSLPAADQECLLHLSLSSSICHSALAYWSLTSPADLPSLTSAVCSLPPGTQSCEWVLVSPGLFSSLIAQASATDWSCCSHSRHRIEVRLASGLPLQFVVSSYQIRISFWNLMLTIVILVAI